MDALHGGGAALSASSAWVEKANLGVILSCGVKTDLKVSSTRGVHLASIDTGGLTNHGAALSCDGRFIAAATFTVDVKCDTWPILSDPVKSLVTSHFQICSNWRRTIESWTMPADLIVSTL